MGVRLPPPRWKSLRANNDSIDSELMSSLGIYGPPAILFFDANGNEIRARRVVGEMSGEQFAAHVAATFQ